MPAIPPRQMLETILKTATLSAKEREAFESMYDATFKFGKLSKRQLSWVEEVYYKQNLSAIGRPPPKKSPKVAFIRDDATKGTLKAHNLEHFMRLRPSTEKGSPLYLKVQEIFKAVGLVFEIRGMLS